MAVFRIESYAYSEGPQGAAGSAAGPTAALQTAQTLAVVESTSPGTTTYERPAVPLLFSDLLALWATDLSRAMPWGAPAGVYTCSYNSTSRRVTLATTNAVAFKPSAVGNELALLGLTQAIGGYSTSWEGAEAPQGIADLLGVTVEPAEDWAVADLTRYRHGRAVAPAWGNHQVHAIKLFARTSAAEALAAGYLTTGRVRIYQGDTVSAYSATNIDGYIDGYVIAAGDLETDGDDESLWILDMLVAVAR